MLAAEQILAALPDGVRRHRRLREVGELVAHLANAGDLKTRTDALVALARWAIRPDGRVPASDTAAASASTAIGYRRLEVLLRLLEYPAVGDPVRVQLGTLLEESEGVRLLAETGLPNDRGLLHDSLNRLFRTILPAPRDDHDLAVLLSRMFPSRSHLRWLDGMPPTLVARLAAALLPDGAAARSSTGRLQSAARDALVLIAARVQGLGLSPDMRERSRPLALRESPFLALAQAAERLLSAVDANGDAEGTAGAATSGLRHEQAAALQTAIDGCRTELAAVKRRLETTGISLDVVYAIEAVEQALFRLEGLSAVLTPAPGPERVAASFHLLRVLARARHAELSLRALGYTNLHILSRKLVERAGRTGEHYIALTRREYSQLLASAAGGGILTMGTAAMKMQITSLYLPLFVEGMFASVNYAVSFILIQLLGFTLATKQPSMTAATLAASIGETSTSERKEELVNQAARIVSSQLAAATGNITTVILAAAGFDAIYQWRTGHAYLTSEKAAYVLESLHPLASGTIFYAALTGVILWISSLAGGWVENFAVYRRLPQAIAEHRASRLVGTRFTRWASDSFARNVSGFGGSVALGLMLGMTPPLGAFFGLPLDVRHVTLSTGTLSLALAAKGVVVIGQPAALAAVAGIAVIFVLNLGVSFALALMVALRAREVPRRDRWAVATAILRRLLRRPQDFFLPPPPEAQRPPVTGAAS